VVWTHTSREKIEKCSIITEKGGRGTSVQWKILVLGCETEGLKRGGDMKRAFSSIGVGRKKWSIK